MERIRKRWGMVVGAAVLCLALFTIITPVAAAAGPDINSGAPPAPFSKGKVILVSLSREWLWAYDNGRLVLNTPVTTARPGLRTPVGTWHIFDKLHPHTFHSPWPRGNPLWYPPSRANYAMGWHSGGYYIHDSPWRGLYGPGTTGWHWDPLMGWTVGSHGCINVPEKVMRTLYYWTPIGTTLKVVR